MTNHQLKIRPHATPKPAKAKQEPRPEGTRNYYLANKAKALRYDYAKIPEEHREQVQQAAFDILAWQRDTVAIGNRLLAVKAMLPHGQFEDWWQTEFGLSERMVQSLLTVARVYGDPANPRRVAGLSDGALYLLAAPSTPEEARAEVEQLLIEGNPPRRAQVKAIIDTHKPPKPKPAKQLPGPSEPDVIEAEYSVMAPQITFAAWLAALPTGLGLREQLAILTLAKATALQALGEHPKLYNAVYGALPTWSQLITAIERELKK